MADETGTQTAQTIRLLKIITVAMVASLVLYLVGVIVVIENYGPLVPGINEYHTIVLTLMMTFAFIFLLVGKKILADGINKAKNSLKSDSDKLNIFRKSFVLYLLVTETPAWITLTLYLLTGSFPFLALAAVLLGLILSSWPRGKKISGQLELNWEEQAEFTKK
ncbi:MAG: hypothetical protein ABWZ25_13905 [Chitinophagaceae bacterium]